MTRYERASLLMIFIEKVFGLPGPDRYGGGQHCRDIHLAECHTGYQAGPRHAAKVPPRDLRGQDADRLEQYVHDRAVHADQQSH